MVFLRTKWQPSYILTVLRSNRKGMVWLTKSSKSSKMPRTLHYAGTLIRSKGSDEQREFLSVLRSSSDYAGWVRSRVKTESGEELPILEENLTEG